MRKRILSCGALFILITAGLFGQNIRGTILGTVRDASGAVISGAKVTVRQPTTGFLQEQNTNGVGEYLFTELPVGTFGVTAEHTGFQTQTRQNIVLEVDQRLREDFTLAVGEVTQTATVEATTPVISTDSATVGNVINNQEVTGLPLNGRNPLQLVTLVPGVNNGVKGSQNQTQGGSVSINGAREQSNNFLLDGVDNNDLAINQWVVPLDPDAMEEFKVAETTYTAEYGAAGAARSTTPARAAATCFTGSPMSTCATPTSTRAISSIRTTSPRTNAISSAPRSADP